MKDPCNFCGLKHSPPHECTRDRISILERRIAVLRHQRNKLRELVSEALETPDEFETEWYRVARTVLDSIHDK